jgi:hypothetical protein
MVLGHFFSMKAATIPEKDTLGYKIASRFGRSLTAAEYRRLKSVIVRIRAVHHSWSVLAYNCNDFVAEVARGMGMQTPTTLCTLRRSTTNYTSCSRLIPRSKPLNLKIKKHSKL